MSTYYLELFLNTVNQFWVMIELDDFVQTFLLKVKIIIFN